MIRIGYARHFAGAVEAAAATGGQITPQSWARLRSDVEYLAVPYQTIIVAAICRTFMHFFGVSPDSLRGKEQKIKKKQKNKKQKQKKK